MEDFCDDSERYCKGKDLDHARCTCYDENWCENPERPAFRAHVADPSDHHGTHAPCVFDRVAVDSLLEVGETFNDVCADASCVRTSTDTCAQLGRHRHPDTNEPTWAAVDFGGNREGDDVAFALPVRVCGASEFEQCGVPYRWLYRTHADAEKICNSVGARLCGSAELFMGAASGTGGGGDSRHGARVWGPRQVRLVASQELRRSPTCAPRQAPPTARPHSSKLEKLARMKIDSCVMIHAAMGMLFPRKHRPVIY